MRFASVAQVKDQLSAYLAQARRDKRPIVVTHHGKPYALIQPISEGDLEALGWGELAKRRLTEAWEGEDDALYDYLCPISSQPRFYRRSGFGDCPLRDWRAVGLRHPSTVRVSKILAVDKAIIKRPLGLLSAPALGRVEAGLRQALSLA